MSKIRSLVASALGALYEAVLVDGDDEPMTTFPIVSCHECRRPYRLEQWTGLQLLSRTGTLERRTCSGCGTEIVTDPSFVEQLEPDALRVSVRTYLSLYGGRR